DFMIPTCWSAIIGGPGISPYAHIETISFNGTGQSKSVRINRDSSGPNANVILVSPELSNLSAGTHRLRFSTFSNEVSLVEVGTLDGLTEDANFNMVGEPVEVQMGVHEYSVDFTSYTETDVLIGIRMTTAYTLFLDDIVWEIAPLCPDVSGLSLVSTETNSASFTWTAGGDEEEWDIAYGTSEVTDPQTLVPVSPAPTIDAEATLSDLVAGTAYKVWVRSVCEAGEGAWIGPVVFTTDCLPLLTANENFDSVPVSTLPACWSSIARGPSVMPEYEYAQTTDMNANSGQQAVILTRSFEDTEVFLVSPSFSTLPLGTHRIKFYALSYNTGGSIELGTLSSNESNADYTPLEVIPLTENYTEYVVDYTSYDGTDTYVALKLNVGWGLFVDDIRWEIAPACSDVTGITTTSTTANSATFSWNPGSDETAWDVVYGEPSVINPNTLVPITPSPSGTPTATITELEANTAYKVWVRSSCTAEDGAWIGPLSFETACLPVVALNEGFDNTENSTLPDCWSSIIRGEDTPDFANVEVVNFSFNSAPSSVRIQSIPVEGEDVESDVILVSPNLTSLQSGTYRLKFYSTSSDPGVLEVGTLNAATVAATFSPLEEVEVINQLTEHTVSFATYTGTDTYIGIRHKTGHSIYVDDIRWEIAPLCDDVQEILVSEIGTDQATVNWTGAGSESGWQIAYGLASVTDPSTLSAGPVLITTIKILEELEDNTDYKIWVRSVCGGTNGNGAWIGPVAFTTSCLPTNVPYTEDFESTDGPGLPNCTSNLNLGTGNNWTVVNNVLTYRYHNNNDANTWFFTQGINLVAGTEYILSYDYGNNSSNVEKLRVFYGLDKNLDAMAYELADHPEITDDAEESNIVTLTPDVSGVYYFGFNAYSEADQNRLFVDNISVSNPLKNEDFITEDFKFSPNPVKDILNLSYKQKITGIAVYNLLGQKVMESNVSATSTQVDLSGLASGSYLVKVSTDNHTKTIKILKQ
ncbi:MAG: T9SS type A sorting domain-containing protein, partial [Chitinophagaceae bacterium]